MNTRTLLERLVRLQSIYQSWPKYGGDSRIELILNPDGTGQIDLICNGQRRELGGWDTMQGMKPVIDSCISWGKSFKDEEQS